MIIPPRHYLWLSGSLVESLRSLEAEYFFQIIIALFATLARYLRYWNMARKEATGPSIFAQIVWQVRMSDSEAKSIMLFVLSNKKYV